MYYLFVLPGIIFCWDGDISFFLFLYFCNFTWAMLSLATIQSLCMYTNENIRPSAEIQKKFLHVESYLNSSVVCEKQKQTFEKNILIWLMSVMRLVDEVFVSSKTFISQIVVNVVFLFAKSFESNLFYKWLLMTVVVVLWVIGHHLITAHGVQHLYHIRTLITIYSINKRTKTTIFVFIS